MITTTFGTPRLQCDTCPTYLVGIPEAPHLARAFAARRYWLTTYRGAGRSIAFDRCPACVERTMNAAINKRRENRAEGQRKAAITRRAREESCA